MFKQEDMIEYFKDNIEKANKYKKVGLVSVRKAVDGEIVVTIIDNVVETENKAGSNHVVVRGPKGELYTMSMDKFKARYVVDKPVTNDFQDYTPSGTCIAFKYLGDSFKFIAPWSEEMLVCSGDYLATTEPSIPEVYRIEKSAFEKTYRKMSS